MDINEQIEELKQQISIRELSDDGYYISSQYKEDCRRMLALQKLLNNKHSPQKRNWG